MQRGVVGLNVGNINLDFLQCWAAFFRYFYNEINVSVNMLIFLGYLLNLLGCIKL